MTDWREQQAEREDPNLERLLNAAKRAVERSQYRVSVEPGAILRLFRQRDEARRALLENAEQAVRTLADPDRRPRIEL